jgi:hypothetical protein
MDRMVHTIGRTHEDSRGNLLHKGRVSTKDKDRKEERGKKRFLRLKLKHIKEE